MHSLNHSPKCQMNHESELNVKNPKSGSSLIQSNKSRISALQLVFGLELFSSIVAHVAKNVSFFHPFFWCVFQIFC